MNLVTIITTRSKSCSVKTLHAILRLNVRCLQRKINNEVCYVTDDPYEKAEVIQKYMKTHDTIGCLVFPGVKEGVDWDMFKTKIRSGSKEPTSQMGLHFDTEVGKKISDNIYNVLRTEARVWMMNTKNVLKIIKDKKTGNCKIHPKMFEQFSERGVRTYAFTASKLTATYTHECVSNILNAAGVKVN